MNKAWNEAQKRWNVKESEAEKPETAPEEPEQKGTTFHETEGEAYQKPISSKAREEAFYPKALADLGNSVLDFVKKTNQHLKLGLEKEKVIEFANKLVDEAKTFYGQFRELGHSVQKAWNQTVDCVATNLKAYVNDLAKTPRLMEANAIALGKMSIDVGVMLYRAIQAFKAYHIVNEALEKRQHGGENKASAGSAPQVKGSAGTSSGGALPPEDPEGSDKPKEFKKRDFEKGDYVDIDRFTKRVPQSGQRARREDPKTGDYIEIDRGVGSGTEHKGSFWKLRDRFGEPIGTFTKEGKFVRGMSTK